MRYRGLCIAACSVAVATAIAAAQQRPPANDSALALVREEGTRQSEVLEMTSRLLDFGPRLTGSPNLRSAAEWIRSRLSGWGIRDVRFETWEPFNAPEWSVQRFSIQMTAPYAAPLHAYAAPWSAGTTGSQSGSVVIASLASEADFARYHGQLTGKWVILSRRGPTQPHFAADARRLTVQELAALSRVSATDSANVAVAKPMLRPRPGSRTAGADSSRARSARRHRFLMDEGVLGILDDGGNDQGAVGSVGSELPDPERSDIHIPVIMVAREDLGRIERLLDHGQTVVVEADIRVRDSTRVTNAFNVIAELRGRDPELRNEVVMFGAHLDSWTAATGATDNGGNAMVMTEALRILHASGVPLKRTVRLALWSGEEQGLLGSLAYARAHFGFADSAGVHLLPEYHRLAAYFNLDNGGGSIRGINLQGLAAARPAIERWSWSLGDLGMTTVTLRSVGFSDHAAFSELGLPAFQFIQDPLDYNTRSWHSSLDAYERLQPIDLIRNAVIVATLVYNAANDDKLLPRRPMAAPR